MSNAVKTVGERKMVFQRTADTFVVLMVTLYRRWKKKDTTIVSKKKMVRFKKFFTQEQEVEFVEHYVFMEIRLFGLKSLELRLLAFVFTTLCTPLSVVWPIKIGTRNLSRGILKSVSGLLSRLFS
jgi:hypothetical protein